MELLFRDIWIFFIAITIAYGIILKFRSKKYIHQNPELKDGYDKYFKGILFFGNIPWIIMATGNISGTTHSIFEYFSPDQMNPIVLVFHASIIVLWALSVWWIYFKNGAEFIEKQPGLIQTSGFNGTSNITAEQIKLFLPLMLLGGIAGMIMMWVMNFPAPQF